jgi:hypothetical protein
MTYEFDKERCCPSIAHHNDTMNWLFNFLFPSTKLHVEPLGEHIINMFLATSKIIGVKQGREEQKLSTFKH